ncbi:MAG: hypothetical protein ACLFT3_12785 [Cyclobacteriaceae bacterium]
MNLKYCFLSLYFLLACSTPQDSIDGDFQNTQSVRGWNILSEHEKNGMEVVEAASDYEINHLQLSHDIIMDLRHVRDTARLGLARRLTDKAHSEGIAEVVVWDHALYSLDYYPDEFKSGPQGTINLDNPDFWAWFRQDYRDMLQMFPEIDGIVLTFIETGAHIEDQYSEQMQTEQEKLARLVDEVAAVIMDEYDKALYIRTFMYTEEEMQSILKCLELIEHQGIRVMMKETPHDFFLTHPVNERIKAIKRPVIIEFDGGHEFSGQGLIMNTFVNTALARWKYYLQQPNVIGYVARTDRFGETTAIGRPHEVNLLAYHRAQQDSSLTAEDIYREFIARRYGEKAVEGLLPVFEQSYDMITATLYSLGLNTANHSKLDFDYPSIYVRHNSGRWLEDKSFFLEHGVGREFHYWADVMNHLAPISAKTHSQMQAEGKQALENDWVDAEEMINLDYVQYVAEEKDYGVSLAESMLQQALDTRDKITDTQAFKELLITLERSLLTARIRRATAKVYYGYRLYARGEDYHSEKLDNIIQSGLDEILEVADYIKNYAPGAPEGGQWTWESDAERALDFHHKTTEVGWEDFGGVVFRLNNDKVN